MVCLCLRHLLFVVSDLTALYHRQYLAFLYVVA